MKKKFLAFLMITALTLSLFAFNSSAKELDSLAEIAALSKLEPVQSSPVNAYTEIVQTKAQKLPSSYSSKDLGYTTPVRQQNANICWAFSSLASLETLLLKSGEKVEHFSPWHMNHWGTMEESGIGWQREDLINDGGYSYIPMGYFTSWEGPLLERELPVGSDKSQFLSATNNFPVRYGVTDIKYIDRETPIDTIKSYIMDYGSVVANFNADTVNYMSNTSDAFYCSDGTIPTGYLYGHAVSIVGWDDNFPKEHFSTSHSGDTPENDGAWLFKNSWGTYANTNGGYFWISYEDAWLFHGIFGPSFAIADYIKIDKSKTIYQNEIYGATTEFTYLTDESVVPADTITYINTFDFSADFPELDKVVFESTSFGADYTVYYIPVYGSTPTRETGIWTKLGSGTVDYTGYISVDVNDFELPEGKGAIGISIDNTKTYNENKNNTGYEYIPNSLGVCEWLSSSSSYYFKNQGEKGESFVMYSEFGQSQIYDLMDFYDTCFDDPMGATFVIKAIAENPDYTQNPTKPETQPTTTTQTALTEPSEPTKPTQTNTISLNITLEFIGSNKLTVVADALGGTGEYEYEFYLNDEIYQSYSAVNYATIFFGEDGEHSLKISAKDSGGRVITSQSSITVENGRLVVPGSTNATDPTETSTNTSSTSPTDIAKTYIIGDTDFNNTIGIKDATLIRKHLAKIIEFDEVAFAVSDVDDSGSCTIKDATLIQKYIALVDAPSNVGKTITLYN